MVTGVLVCDPLLGDIHVKDERRSEDRGGVRPIVAAPRRLDVAAAGSGRRTTTTWTEDR